MKLKTELVTYSFDLSIPGAKEAWEQFKAERAKGPSCYGPVYHDFKTLSGAPIQVTFDTGYYSELREAVTLDCGEGLKNLFDNQWNAETAGNRVRVFDWFLQAYASKPYGAGQKESPSHIRRGHYLVQTDEMRELRRITNKCGYCGHREAAARGLVFCDKCVSSSNLKTENLHLLRMQSFDTTAERGPLSKSETDYLLPLYLAAQAKGNKAKAEKDMLERAEKRDKAIANAWREYNGFAWCVKHGVNIDNLIYYTHSEKFSFGWRDNGLSESVADHLLSVISEFPFAYEIKRDHGPKLEGY